MENTRITRDNQRSPAMRNAVFEPSVKIAMNFDNILMLNCLGLSNIRIL